MTDLAMTRRMTLGWLMASVAASCSPWGGGGSVLPAAAEPSGKSYGFDPDRMNPTVPWSLTMSPEQLALTAKLSDVIVPADDRGPSARELNAQNYVDEWVSAPYPEQRDDRIAILGLLDAIERDCHARSGASAANAPDEVLKAVLDDFAWADRVVAGREKDAVAFGRLRRIVIGVYATSEPGRTELGYLGNMPMSGAYPKPPAEAMDHLMRALEEKGLSLA